MKNLGLKWPSLLEEDNRLWRKHRMPKEGLKGVMERKYGWYEVSVTDVMKDNVIRE